VTRRPPHVLLLGASGFLGANVAHSLASDGAVGREVIVHGGASAPAPLVPGSRTVLADLTDAATVDDVLSDVRRSLGAGEPILVVNCVALADVDRCEAEPDRAELLNATLPERLATRCAADGMQLLHVSTDAVFDGRSGPYREDHPVAPTNVYERSKARGETLVLAALPTALVARTNIVGWSPTGRRSLLEHFHDRLAGGEQAPGFTDIAFRPLPVHWFWPTCAALLAHARTGLRHVTGPELLSKHAFGLRVARAFGLDEALVVPSSGLTGRAALRAPSLDVVPSRLPDERWPRGGRGRPDLDGGLGELRAAAQAGFRQRIAATGIDPSHQQDGGEA
jgi:dTDP-4-dehydrorhamnose reductase